MRRGEFIFVKNLVVKGLAGRDAWQRQIPQPLKLSLSINVANRFKRLGFSDDLRRTLNYDALCTQVAEKLETSKSNSAEEAARIALNEVKSVLQPYEQAEILLSQPKAVLRAEARTTLVKTDTNLVKESLRNLRLPVIIGVNNLERVYLQTIVLDIEVTRNIGSEVFTPNVIDIVQTHVDHTRWLTIESFANDLASLICRNSLVLETTVRASKPSALNLADGAAVQVTRSASDYVEKESTDGTIVYIAFGTNQGERLKNIRESVGMLQERGIKVLKTSQIYESEPMYFAPQRPFMNGVFKCSTQLKPLDLLKALKEIEYEEFNRVKLFDNGPRPMDLDIILYGDEFIETEDLVVPHRDMLNRPFVLRPLHDVVPNCTYPNPGDGIRRIVPLKGEEYLVVDNGTQVMSIMNATPDSFSDGGKLSTPQNIEQAVKSHSGAQIIDIGGYSTRPGAAEVSEEEEIERVCKMIEQVSKVTNQPISIDTFRSKVADNAIRAGASIINDVYSGQLDSKIFSIARKHGVPLCLTHSRGNPKSMKQLTDYKEGLIPGVASELKSFISKAEAEGCAYWQLMLDPGIGFAKTAEQDMELIKNFSELKKRFALPWVVGPSRKSFLAAVLGDYAPDTRDAGTAAVLTALAAQRAEFVRVHNSELAVDTIAVANKIYSTK